jgi:hypothetical protein
MEIYLCSRTYTVTLPLQNPPAALILAYTLHTHSQTRIIGFLEGSVEAPDPGSGAFLAPGSANFFQIRDLGSQTLNFKRLVTIF